ERLGLVATCNSGGAGKWPDDFNFSEPLKGCRLFILPDNDQAGRDHAGKVQETLRRPGITANVVTLPGPPEKGAIGGWVAQGGTREKLLALCVAAAGSVHPKQPRARSLEAYRPFPLEALPDPIRLYVRQVTRALGPKHDAAFVALPVLAVVASAI